MPLLNQLSALVPADRFLSVAPSHAVVVAAVPAGSNVSSRKDTVRMD